MCGFPLRDLNIEGFVRFRCMSAPNPSRTSYLLGTRSLSPSQVFLAEGLRQPELSPVARFEALEAVISDMFTPDVRVCTVRSQQRSLGNGRSKTTLLATVQFVVRPSTKRYDGGCKFVLFIGIWLINRTIHYTLSRPPRLYAAHKLLTTALPSVLIPANIFCSPSRPKTPRTASMPTPTSFLISTAILASSNCLA